MHCGSSTLKQKKGNVSILNLHPDKYLISFYSLNSRDPRNSLGKNRLKKY